MLTSLVGRWRLWWAGRAFPLPLLTVFLAVVLVIAFGAYSGSQPAPPSSGDRLALVTEEAALNPSVILTMTATGPYTFVTELPNGRAIIIGRLGSGVEVTLRPDSQTPPADAFRGPLPTHPPDPSELANMRATPPTAYIQTVNPPSTSRPIPPRTPYVITVTPVP